MFMSLKYNRLFVFFDEHVFVFVPSLCATYPINLTCLSFIMPVTFVESFKARSPLLCDSICRAVPSFLQNHIFAPAPCSQEPSIYVLCL